MKLLQYPKICNWPNKIHFNYEHSKIKEMAGKSSSSGKQCVKAYYEIRNLQEARVWTLLSSLN